MDEMDFRHCLEEGRKLYKERNWPEALRLLLNAYDSLLNGPEKAETSACIGVCYAHLGEFELSDRYAQRSYEECDDPILADYYRGAFLYHHGEYEESLRLFECLCREHAAEFSPGELDMWCGINQSEIGDYEAAADNLQRARLHLDGSTNPQDYVKLLYEYGLVLRHLNQNERALAAFEECEQYAAYLPDSNLAQLHYLASRILRETGKYESALDHANIALSIVVNVARRPAQDTTSFRLELARCQVNLGLFEEALSNLAKIPKPIEDDWDEWLFLGALSKSLFNLQKFYDAIEPLRLLLSHPETKKAAERTEYVHTKMLAIALYKTGELKEARRLVESLLSKPETTELDKEEMTALLMDPF